MRSAAVCVVLCVLGSPALAVNKCVSADGRTVFQDAPCSAGRGEKVNIRPAMGSSAGGARPANEKLQAEIEAINRRAEIRAAIERREPMVGMTREELQQALGSPHRANLADYNGVPHDQLIYERGGRTLYVYVNGNVVRSIQNTESFNARQRPSNCPTPLEFRNLETGANTITISEEARNRRLSEIRRWRRDCYE